MKIAIWHNLPSGGGKRALYDQVRGLVKLGHHIEAWCPSTADVDFLPLKDTIVEHVLPVNWPKGNRFSKYDPLEKRRLISRQLRVMKQHCRQCAREINDGGFDLLLSHPCMFFATSPIGHYISIPKILYLAEPKRVLYEAMPESPWQAVDLSGSKKLSPYWLGKSIKKYFATPAYKEQIRLEQFNAAAYDEILVNSLYSRESVLRAYGLDSKVCYLGIDTSLFKDNHSTREKVVIGVGAFDVNKNIDFVIKSIALMPDPRPSLVWIGNAEYGNYLQDMIALAHLLMVDFIPKVRISENELIALLNKAQVMVYAPRLEPFGYGPLEANACGIPVVAVAEGGVRETVIDRVNGLIVEHSPASMASAIHELLINPELATTLGKNGRELVLTKWSQEAAINRLLDRIEEVVSKSHGDSNIPTKIAL